jgi:hypothetical protein
MAFRHVVRDQVRRFAKGGLRDWQVFRGASRRCALEAALKHEESDGS